jgi:hypothetical protein
MERNQRLMLIGLSLVLSLAIPYGCGSRQLGIVPGEPEWTVFPGESKNVQNPIGPNTPPCTDIPGGPAGPDGWYVDDAFFLIAGTGHFPFGLSVSPALLTQGQSTRQLVAAPPPAAVSPLFRQRVAYAYLGADTSHTTICQGHVLVTTVLPLKVSVSAAPTTIAPGQTSQLQATATGGAGPYDFNWMPGTSLTGNGTASPVATPSTTTTYSVTVTDRSNNNVVLDSGGSQTASASVTVSLSGSTSFTLTVTNQLFDIFGVMSSTPAGISCPKTCSASFASGTTVVLLLQGVGPPFWNGCNSVTNSNDPTSGLVFSRCTVVMDADKNVFAGI